MESDDLLQRLRDYMTMEQEFYHQRFMSRARKIDKVEDFVEILDLLHSNYLVQKRLFHNLAKSVADSGVELPALGDLLKS
jgi:hypothetical protein